MKKKRILFFIYQMGAGGAARTMLNILNNLDRSRFIPILVTLNYNGSYEEHIARDVKFIKLPVKRLRKGIIPLAKVIRRENIDIVFSTIPNYNTIAILSNMLSFSKAKNVVREADNLNGGFLTKVKLRFYGLLYKCTSQVISLSEGVKHNLVTQYKLKQEKIKVIYNPIDVSHIQKQMNMVADMNNELFNGNENIIITAGRLVEQKDHHTLLQAFAKVRKQIPAKLIILGEGPLESQLRDQARRLHLSEQVEFLGFQQNPYAYFKKADLFALSSVHEGFSHVLAESLACGTPIVSTDCPSGPSEVLANGKYGLLCEVGNVAELANKMVQVLTYSSEKKQDIIAAGYKRAEYFQAKKIVNQYADVFWNL